MPKLFKNYTIQEKLAAWLISKGYEEKQCKSGKYKFFHRPGLSLGYLLGKSGAIRRTPDGTAGRSFSVKPSLAFSEWCKVQGGPVRRGDA